MHSTLNRKLLPCIEMTAVFFHSPHSYTGEDLLEISIPGTPVLKDMLMNELVRFGFRVAGPGEFTRRAFENGRICLSQAQAVLDLIHSVDDAARRASLTVLTGGLGSQMLNVRSSILDVLSRIEANLDFGEEDIRIIDPIETIERIAKSLMDIESILKVSRHVNSEIPRVVIAGPVNSGKTTLFNLLSTSDALMSDLEGTTTDPLCSELEHNGIRFAVWDTPGATKDISDVSYKAMKLSEPLITGSSVVLNLCSINDYLAGSDSLPDSLGGRVLLEITKCDLNPNKVKELSVLRRTAEVHFISSRTGQGVTRLLDAITSVLEHTASAHTLGDWQFEALSSAVADLSEIELIYQSGLPEEIAAVPIRSAIKALDFFEGRDASEEVLDRIFSSFCIGK